MKKFTTGIIAFCAIALPGTVLAHGGPPADVFTETTRGTATQVFQGPCGDGPGTVTLNFHDTFHVTAFDGHVHVVANQAGTFSFEPFDPSEVSATGRYRVGNKSVEHVNGGAASSVFVVVGRDENGDQVKFRITSNFVVSNGDVRVDSFDVDCD